MKVLLDTSTGKTYEIVAIHDVAIQKPTLIEGAIVFCELLDSLEWHSGVYVGGGRIIELNSLGNLVVVDINQFVHGTPYRTGKNLHVFCDLDGRILYDPAIALMAKCMRRVNPSRFYNIIFNNCHKFTASCIIEKLPNNTITFEHLKQVLRKRFGPITSRVIE